MAKNPPVRQSLYDRQVTSRDAGERFDKTMTMFDGNAKLPGKSLSANTMNAMSSRASRKPISRSMRGKR